MCIRDRLYDNNKIVEGYSFQTYSCGKQFNLLQEYSPLHVGSNSEISVVKAKAALKTKAVNSSIPPAAIYAEVIAESDEGTRMFLPEESNLKRSIRRNRQPIHPPEPNTLQELTINGDYALTKGAVPQRFLLYDNGRGARNRIIAFATDDDVRLMANSQTYMMDGNFKMSPKNFLQLYVIHVPLGPHNSVPVVYAFMEQKSFDSYCELFDVIMNKATEFGLVLQPDLVIVDFEIATHQALRQRIDVNISIGGCFFHKRGSTWQKVQDLGEVERYVLQCSNDTPGMYI